MPILRLCRRPIDAGYFAGMSAKNAAAVCDARTVLTSRERAELAAINGIEVLNTRVINLSRGCDVQCPFCYASSPGTIENMGWESVKELGARLSSTATVHQVNFDGDALRNYHDSRNDTDFGDAARVLPFSRIPTAGFEPRSIGERAARKIAEHRRDFCIVINFSLLSGWALRLGERAYASAMGNVFETLQPDEITAFINHENRAATCRAIAAAGGDRFNVDYVFPHREGRATLLPEEDTCLQPGGSVLPMPVMIFEPNGEISFALPRENSHIRATIRPAGQDLSPGVDLRLFYHGMLLNPIQRGLRSLGYT